MRIVAAVLAISGLLAGAAHGAPPATQALKQAHISFCVPVVVAGGGLANAEAAAKALSYERATLPVFPGLSNREAPAWRVPTAGGEVTVSLGGARTAGAPSCEITVTGLPSQPIAKALEEAVLCPGCPFVKDEGRSVSTGAVKSQTYKWQHSSGSLITVLAVSDERSANAPTFFEVIYKVP